MTREDIIQEGFEFREGAVEALQRFKDRKTFKLTELERWEAMKELIGELATIYNIPTPRMAWSGEEGFQDSGFSHYDGSEHRITMLGRLSIITLLHEFAHALGESSQLFAQRFAVNLFRKVYPKQFADLDYDEVSGMFFQRGGAMKFRTIRATQRINPTVGDDEGRPQ